MLRKSYKGCCFRISLTWCLSDSKRSNSLEPGISDDWEFYNYFLKLFLEVGMCSTENPKGRT